MTCSNVALRFISAAMGCLFGCFRCPPRTHLVSEPAFSRSRRNVNSPNQFTSLLVSEEHDESPLKDEPSSGFQQTEISDKDLQYEAKFIKACGILVETPAEIRKSREKLQNSDEQDSDSGSPKFHSWYPDTSVEKLCLKKKGQAQSLKSLKLCEEWHDASSSSEHSTDSFISCVETGETGGSLTVDKRSQLASLTSCISKIQDNELDNSPVINSIQLPSAAVKSRAKSVHFAREPEMRLSCKVEQSSCKVEMPGYHGVLEYSPHPTPLKLTDEMQTPGTIYAANLDSATRGRNARIRSQYVYAALNPVETISQLRILKEDEAGEGDNREMEEPDTVAESSVHFYYTPGNSSGKENKDVTDKDAEVEATLSDWLCPPPSSIVNKTESHEVLHTQTLGLTRGGRPILGVLPASCWNRDGSLDVSTKCWDGNGTPNTTTKYREYQKVRWYATPFEEMLENALSVECSIPDRRHMDGIAIVYEDKEDEGTESLILQSSTHHKETGLPLIEHHIDIVS